MMRVAVVVRSLKIGGMERSAVNLSEAFANEGHESHLIYFKDKKRVFTPNKNVNFHHFNLDKILNLTFVGMFFKIIAKFLNAIFRNTYFIYNGLMLSPIFKYKIKKLEKKYGKFDLIIMRGHGTFETVWNYSDDRIVQVVESVFIKHGTFLSNFYIRCVYLEKNLVSVSSGVKEKIEEVLKVTNIKVKSLNVIYNLLDIATIEHKSVQYIPDINFKYIVSVGRITPNKNISFLIESYKYARDHLGFDYLLVLVGDGHDMQNVKHKVKELNLDRYVKFVGLIENPYPWIKHASLLTSTSFAEGFGMVLIEALACKTRVLTTKSKGGVREIMENDLAQYMVEFDVPKFAIKIVNTVKESKAWQFDKYILKFSSEEIVQMYQDLYS